MGVNYQTAPQQQPQQPMQMGAVGPGIGYQGQMQTQPQFQPSPQSIMPQSTGAQVPTPPTPMQMSMPQPPFQQQPMQQAMPPTQPGFNPMMPPPPQPPQPEQETYVPYAAGPGWGAASGSSAPQTYGSSGSSQGNVPGGTQQPWNNAWSKAVPTTPGAGVQKREEEINYYSGGGMPPGSGSYDMPNIKPKKKGKYFLTAGIIILIVGIIGIILTGFLQVGSFEAKSISEMKDDYDLGTGTFDSYHEGDELVIKGEITNKQDASEYVGSGYYSYELDNENFGIYGDDDIGEEGDNIIAFCEVKEVMVIGGDDYEVLVASSSIDETENMIYLLVAIIHLIIGIILIIVGVVKNKSTTVPTTYMPERPIGQPYSRGYY